MIKKAVIVIFMCMSIGTINAAESFKNLVEKIRQTPNCSEISLPEESLNKTGRTSFAWSSTGTEFAKEYSPSSKRTITTPGGKETIIKAIIVLQKKEVTANLTHTYIITDTGDCFKQKPKKVEKVHEERTSHTSTLSCSWILCGCC